MPLHVVVNTNGSITPKRFSVKAASSQFCSSSWVKRADYLEWIQSIKWKPGGG